MTSCAMRRRLAAFLLRPCLGLALIAASLATLRAQGQVVEDWTRTVTLLGSHIYGAMIATDAQDSIYATGHYPRYRIVTAKFAPDGTPLWQVDFSNPGTREEASWLAVDPFGDVLVAGYNVTASSSSTQGQVLLKYGPTGTLLWSHVTPGFNHSLSRVATDTNGDVVVVGNDPAGVVKKYSRLGTLLWSRPIAVNLLSALAIDDAGQIFVAGSLATTVVTTSFDPAGNVRWSRTTPSANGATDLALGPAGEVYVAGAALTIAANRSLVAKFAANGTPTWVRTYPGTQTRRLAVDRHGDVVFVSGIVNGYFDWITQKISPVGTVLWSRNYQQHQYNDELPYAVTIGPDDEIYVTGQGGPGPTSGQLSYLRTVTVRYSKTGVQEWVGSSFTSLRSLGVVLLRDNTVATIGESTFTVFHYRQTAVWRSLDGGLAGAAGLPHLEGTGSPRSGTPVTLELSQAATNALAWTVVGFSRQNLPMFGGILVPVADVVLGAHVLSPTGQLSLPLSWPAGLPPGFEMNFQTVILDAAAPFGFAASNALAGVSL